MRLLTLSPIAVLVMNSRWLIAPALCLFIGATSAFAPGLRSSAHSAQFGNLSMYSMTTSARPLRIAVVQMQSADHDIDGNLKRATVFAEKAAEQGARLV